jgi:RNA polymerase sigma-70 factor (ECF subfamily)
MAAGAGSDRRFADEATMERSMNTATTWRQVDGVLAPALPSPPATAPAAAHDFAAIYATYFVDVARWVRALGANDADVEDLTQEVFIIVRRKLDTFDGRNLRGFLYRIAQRTVRDHRRSAWFRNLIRGHATIEVRGLAARGPTGLQALEQAERHRTVQSILAKMSEKRRTTFVLFEIEGYSGEEIAQIQSLPVRTVWTRLHHARKDFLRMVSELPPSRTRGDE